MTADHQFLPEVFVDGILDLHFEGGVFRLTLAQLVPQEESTTDTPRNVLMPKATLLLTEDGFGSLCDVVEQVRSEIAKHQQDETESSDQQDEIASSPNF